jgi:hypothetical protein
MLNVDRKALLASHVKKSIDGEQCYNDDSELMPLDDFTKMAI